jgi:hypothetical protein
MTELIFDMYGNYVVQKILQVSESHIQNYMLNV